MATKKQWTYVHKDIACAVLYASDLRKVAASFIPVALQCPDQAEAIGVIREVASA